MNLVKQIQNNRKYNKKAKERREKRNINKYIPEEDIERRAKEEEIFSGYLGYIAEKHHG